MATVSDLFQRMPGGHIEASEWGRRYADDLGHAWVECPRGDWLAWLAAILETPPQLLMQAICDCTRFALSLLPEDQQEDHLAAVLDMADRWVAEEATSAECGEVAAQVLAVYQDPEALKAREGESPIAGYATAAVAAAVNVATFTSTFGLASGCAAAVLAAAQVATPIDETATLDAQQRCADIIRERIQFHDLVGTRGFRLYARSVPPPEDGSL